MDSKKLSSSVLEPDIIVQGDKIVYMSDNEQKRRVVGGMVLLFKYVAPQLFGGRL